jgi:hypothetical protein
MTSGPRVRESVLSKHLLTVERLMREGSEARPDERLKTRLSGEAFNNLSRRCEDKSMSIDFRDWLDGGHTEAVVALVRLRGAGPYRNAVLKYCPAQNDQPQPDFQAFKRAAPSGPKRFAREHLVSLDSLSDPPIRDGDKGLFLIMGYPSGKSSQYVTMNNLLGRSPLPVACKTIVRHLLQTWNKPDRSLELERGEIAAHAFLKEVLGIRCDKGRNIRNEIEAIERKSPDFYRTALGTDLPRPLNAVLSGEGLENIWLPGVRGNGHGDLHVDNILIPTPEKGSEPTTKEFNRFMLIDLSTFDDNRLLAVDPAHLLLSIVAVELKDLSGQSREDLADAILAPDSTDVGNVPTRLAQTLLGIHEAGKKFASDREQYDEWPLECLTATMACALLFLGRSGIDDARRRWFLRLAARALSVLQERAPRSGRGLAPVIPIGRGAADPVETCGRLAAELVHEIGELPGRDTSSAQDAATATVYARAVAEDLANALDGARTWYAVQRPDLRLAYSNAIGIAEVQLTDLQRVLDEARSRALDRTALNGLLRAAETLTSRIGEIRQAGGPSRPPDP